VSPRGTSGLLPPTDSRVSGWIGVIVLGVFSLLLARLFQLQILQGPTHVELAERQRTRPERTPGRTLAELPSRGAVFDRAGRPVATSHYEHKLTLDVRLLRPAPPRADGVAREEPARVVARKAAARAFLAAELPRVLARLGVAHDAGRVAALVGDGLDPAGRRVAYATLAARLTPRQKRDLLEELDALEAAAETAEERRVRRLARTALSFEDAPARAYPYGELTTQVLGIVANSGLEGDDRTAGQFGLERELEVLLAGAPGLLGGEQTSGGKRFKTCAARSVDPLDGAALTLTVDVEVQRVLYEALRRNAKKYKSLRASAVVLDARDGGILGIASIPATAPEGDAFDPKGMVLGAVSDSLEPGSTIKPINFAWAVEKGRVSGGEDERFDCGGWDKTETFGGRAVKDYSVNPQPLTFTEILYRSSNVGATRIGLQRLGLAGLYEAYEKFRLLEKPGSGLPGESSPYIYPQRGDRRLGLPPARDPWEGVSFCQGYGLQVSPLGLAAAYTVFATGGERLAPCIVRSVERGDHVFRPTPRRTRVLSRRAADSVRRGMISVIDHPKGTAHATAYSDKYVYMGKTGTSQFDYRHGATRDYNAWMAAIAPAQDPRIVVVVVHHKVNISSNSAYTGGAISGPVVKEVTERTLELLGVPHDRVDALAAASAEAR